MPDSILSLEDTDIRGMQVTSKQVIKIYQNGVGLGRASVLGMRMGNIRHLT